MARYVVKWDYESHAMKLKAGQVIDLTDELAEWLQRDSRGALELIVPLPPPADPAPVVERVVDTPPADRMMRRGRKRKEV